LRLVSDNPVKIDAAHSLGIFGAVQADDLPSRQGDGQFRLVNFAAVYQQRGAIVFQIGPSNVFGLDEIGGEIAIPGRRKFPRVFDCLADQLVNARNGLPGAAVAY
jgi:hypothetical protein